MLLCRLAIQISKSDFVSDFLCRRKTARTFTRPQSLCQEVFSLFFRSPQQLIAIQELTQKNRHRPTTSRRQLQLPNFFFSKEPDCLLPSTSAPTALFPVESGAPFSRLPLHCQLFFFRLCAFFFSTTRHRLPPPPRLTMRRRSAGLKCRCSGPPRGRRQSASGRGVPSLYI